MKATIDKTKSITIIGRRWFQRTYGNTYHTAEILIDGELVHKTPRQYGYGDQYIQTAMAWLSEHGYTPDFDYKKAWPREYFAEHGIAFAYSAADVDRQKDL